MGCNCRTTELILAIVIIVFALWVTAWSQWVIVIAAVLLLIHSHSCKNCKTCPPMPALKSSGKSRKKR